MLKKARLLTRPTPARRDAPFRGQGRSSAADPRFTYHASLERRENAAGGLFQHPDRGGAVMGEWVIEPATVESLPDILQIEEACFSALRRFENRQRWRHLACRGRSPYRLLFLSRASLSLRK